MNTGLPAVTLTLLYYPRSQPALRPEKGGTTGALPTLFPGWRDSHDIKPHVPSISLPALAFLEGCRPLVRLTVFSFRLAK